MDDLSEQQVRVAHMVADEAERQGIPVPLALAAAMQESSFQQLKKSGTGPQGVMMVGKAASKDLGIDPKKVNENIRGGITYLKQQLDKNNWDYDKALVAYHDGPNSPYVLGTGPMSAAAENHIAKVKEYGGYEGYQPVAATADEPVDTSVAPVEQINYVEPSASGEESSGTDLLAAGIGAAAGALKSPHKPQSMHSIDQHLEEHRLATKPIVAANKALEDQYKADVRTREEAIALRKSALDAANNAAGSGVRNYTQKEFGGNIPQTINPLDMGEAQSMGQQAVKAERRVQQMMPGVQFDPTRGLLLPPSVQPMPKVAPPPIDAGLPPVRAPKLAPIPEPQIYKGSMLGRAGTSVGGAAALGLGANSVDRALSGDTTGAVLGGLAAAGGAGTQARNPRTAAISGAAGLGALGTQMLYDKFKPKEKSVLEGFDKGGVVKKLAGVVEPKAKEAWQYGAQQAGKLSDWIQNHIGNYVVPTQADRMAGVGGPSYSANQLGRPEYEGRAWGNMSKAAAQGLGNLATDPRFGGAEGQIFMPLLGAENMHQSNQLIFDKMVRQFYKDPSKLPPELRDTINTFMQSGGATAGGKERFHPVPGFDIADKAMVRDLGSTFDARKNIAAHAFGGEGVGGRKAQIIPYQDILDATRDPMTKGAPTFAMGPRAFRLSGEVEQTPRPDLNKAYPWQLMGKDLEQTFQPVPAELSLMDFQRGWRENTGKTLPLKSGALPQPGYYEHTLGYKPAGSSDRIYPRQQVTEEWIKELQRSGFAEGGLAHC